MRTDTSWEKPESDRVAEVQTRSAGSLPTTSVAAKPNIQQVAHSEHDNHGTHGADVEHTGEYRFFFLLVFAVFLFVGCIRYVLAISSVLRVSGDQKRPVPHPLMEGRSMARIYVPYIFQL